LGKCLEGRGEPSAQKNGRGKAKNSLVRDLREIELFLNSKPNSETRLGNLVKKKKATQA